LTAVAFVLGADDVVLLDVVLLDVVLLAYMSAHGVRARVGAAALNTEVIE